MGLPFLGLVFCVGLRLPSAIGHKASPLDRLTGMDAKLDRAQEHLVFIKQRGNAWVSEQKSWESPPDQQAGAPLRRLDAACETTASSSHLDGR